MKVQIETESINKHREKFPGLIGKNYLNFGGQGVMSRAALDAITGAYNFVQEHGPFSSSIWTWMLDVSRGTKEAIAAELGGAASGWALTQNATEGCNIVLWGVEWNEGDVLLTTDSEHNGVMTAVKQVCKRKKLRLELCNFASLQTEDEILEETARALKMKPKLFMLSHVLWNTGKVLPCKKIVEMCREHGVMVLVDGAQSAGVLPLNLAELNANFYAITGHKWIGGPEGLGALYVAADSLDLIEPTFSGWRGSNFDSSGQPTGWLPDASRFEVATAPFPLLTGLTAALKEHQNFANSKTRYELISANVKTLRQELSKIDGISFLDDAGESSLVSFKLANASHVDIVKNLEKNKTIVRTIPKPTCIRASVHYFSEQEVKEFPDALREAISKASS